jgi:chemosensory pili system protein ChpA (sensor histidine kinase/response regulator)
MSRILIVEDSVGFRLALSRGLECRGHTVLQAENGVEGLEHDLSEVDIALVDHNMPKMNGYEFLQKAKKDSHNLTGYVIGIGNFPVDKRDVLDEYIPKHTKDQHILLLNHPKLSYKPNS